MNTSVHNHEMLHFIQYSQMQGWSVLRHVQRSFGYTDRYPLVAIGEFLRQVRNEITVQDDVEYKQLTVKTKGGGVCLRTTRMGRDIGTKQQWRASAGQFVISKIDARNGAMGIVSEEMDGAIVTHDFPLFSIDEDRINPQFLLLITTTNAFQQFAQSCSSGTTNRQRINISKFLQQQIPLPTIEEQDEMVERFNIEKSNANRNLEISNSIETGLKGYLATKLHLGFKGNGCIKEKEGFNMLRFVENNALKTRWDESAKSEQLTSKYDIVSVDTITNDIKTGTTPPTSHKEYFDGKIKFFTPTDIDDEMYLSDTERTLTIKAVEDGVARCFKTGDVLFVGIGSTVGKVGIVKDEMVTSNQQIMGLTINNDLASSEYVYTYMAFNKEITTANRSITTLPIVNQTNLLRVPIPLPPLTVQQEIVSHVKAEREKAKTLREEAEALRQKAIENFESKIFE